MTHDELKKCIGWGSQLLQFALGIKDEVKGNVEWEKRAHNLLEESRLMIAMVHDEVKAMMESTNAAS